MQGREADHACPLMGIIVLQGREADHACPLMIIIVLQGREADHACPLMVIIALQGREADHARPLKPARAEPEARHLPRLVPAPLRRLGVCSGCTQNQSAALLLASRRTATGLAGWLALAVEFF